MRVRVHAASVNGFDVAVANGYLKGMMEHRFPVVLGKDFAGTVDAVGAGVDRFQVGDRVFGVVTKPYLGDGSFAEYVTVPDRGRHRRAAGWRSTSSPARRWAWPVPPRSPRSTPPTCSPARPSWSRAPPAASATRSSSSPPRPGPYVVATASSDAEQALVRGSAGHHLRLHRRRRPRPPEAHPIGVDVVIHLAGDPAALLPAVRDRWPIRLHADRSPEQLPIVDATAWPPPSPETPTPRP